MKESRPTTRSMVRKISRSLAEQGTNHKYLSQKEAVKYWIDHQVYDPALKLLAEVDPIEHWIFCQRAQIYYQMGLHHDTTKSINQSLCLKRNGCI